MFARGASISGGTRLTSSGIARGADSTSTPCESVLAAVGTQETPSRDGDLRERSNVEVFLYACYGLMTLALVCLCSTFAVWMIDEIRMNRR